MCNFAPYPSFEKSHGEKPDARRPFLQKGRLYRQFSLFLCPPPSVSRRPALSASSMATAVLDSPTMAAARALGMLGDGPANHLASKPNAFKRRNNSAWSAPAGGGTKTSDFRFGLPTTEPLAQPAEYSAPYAKVRSPSRLHAPFASTRRPSSPSLRRPIHPARTCSAEREMSGSPVCGEEASLRLR